MERNDRTNVDGKPENTNRELNMQPGRMEDIENATAYANRTGQSDVTSGRAASQGEQMHDRDGMLAREGMADTTGNPMERGERQAGTGGGADRVTPGEDIGGGIRAKPADGVQDNDGRVTRGEDIGNGIRARGAGEQDPGNPLV